MAQDTFISAYACFKRELEYGVNAWRHMSEPKPFKREVCSYKLDNGMIGKSHADSDDLGESSCLGSISWRKCELLSVLYRRFA